MKRQVLTLFLGIFLPIIVSSAFASEETATVFRSQDVEFDDLDIDLENETVVVTHRYHGRVIIEITPE